MIRAVLVDIDNTLLDFDKQGSGDPRELKADHEVMELKEILRT